MAAFQLEIELFTVVFLSQSIALNQRRIPFTYGKQRGFLGDGEVFFILEKDSLFQS
jgi:hypothetical protein